jgi:peptide alpha-N-acetyltransferase
MLRRERIRTLLRTMTKSKGKSKPKSKQKAGSASAQGHATPSQGQPPEVHDSDSTKDLEAGEAAAAAQQQQVERPLASALASIPEDAAGETTLPPIEYIGYESEHQLSEMISLIENDLSEPYSIYTYRYFLHQWPKLSFLVRVSPLTLQKRNLLIGRSVVALALIPTSHLMTFCLLNR